MIGLQPEIDYREQGSFGFRPAFMNSSTCGIYLARLGDGRLAGYHSTEGLADAVGIRRRYTGRLVSVKPTLIPGFERNGFFYTCIAAVRATNEWATR